MTRSVYTTMDGYYAQDGLRAIWEEISNLHISYLNMEDGSKKIIKRRKLEDTIAEFLSLAPHNQKFIFSETSHVLHRSASSKKDFSGYRAAVGWNAIAMYAANLWNQPWRNEYREIKLYSGYYKHQIDANLFEPEIIFKLMGYNSIGNEKLVLDGPICPDKVISISQDALVAYVECQVLKAIWEEVSASFKISWLEVLEFRHSHVCSPKHSVQALKYRCQERQFQQHTRSHSQVPVQPAPHVCPTGQLIEVETQNCDASSKSQTSNNEESWDYVYKDLENQGYSKDLGERGDLLENRLEKKLKVPITETTKLKPQNLEKMIDYLSLNDKKQATMTLSENGHTKNVPEVKTSNSDVANNKLNDTKTNGNKYLSHTLKPKQINGKMSSKSTCDMTNKWQCTTCTYLNNQKLDICEMCSKSRVAIQDEMEIGGSQCSQCTLVNRKDNKVCSACSNSLKGSPTYI